MDVQSLLPNYITREQTCCFTGHRVIASRHRETIVAAVDRYIKKLYDAGYRCFMAGGALGFDMLAETEVLRAARFAKDIRLILALPCRDQTMRWERVSGYVDILKKYREILGRADYVLYASDFYTDTCMQERNRFMIDRSSACVAYYGGATHSGAGQTYRTAVSEGLDVYNIWNDIDEHPRISNG